MLFNSIDFAVFLPIVFLLYWFVVQKSLKYQNLFLVVVSYLFYGWWDYRFLALILFSSALDYVIGLKLSKTDSRSKRRLLLTTSILVNIGFLGFFKYYNFFVDNFVEAFSLFGKSLEVNTLKIILPVGISFYTFQTLSYTIDVYRKKLKPTNDWISFFAFVCFFPQLVAGPIERATNLLPQFYKKRVFNKDMALDGTRLIIWGLFKKMVIADSCAVYVNSIWDNYETLDSLTLVLGAVYFAFQIYGDFSGYSDIAIGTSKLLGFNLMRNFNYPYFSRDIAEFWRRWHISLSTWFRDYVYIPLGGSRGNKYQQVRNVFVIFLVSGFWHGANWTFIAWGFLNALYFLPLLLTNRNRKNLSTVTNNLSVRDLLSMLATFSLTVFAWVFFRSDTIQDAFQFIKRVFDFENFKLISSLSIERYSMELLLLVIFFIVIEWRHRDYEHPFQENKYLNIKLFTIILLTLILGVYSNHLEFIYFQF